MPEKINFTKEQIIHIVESYQNGGLIGKLAKSLKVSDKTIQRVLKEENVWIKNKYPILRACKYKRNSNFFEDINSWEKAYWLGFIAADGYVRIDRYNRLYLDIRLSTKDKGQLDSFLFYLSSNDLIHTYKNGFNNHCVALSICDKKLVNDLFNLGISQRKSLSLEWPKYKRKKILDRAFLLGYFDGDGCWTKTSGKLKFNVIGSKNFILEYQKIICEYVKIKPSTIQKIGKVCAFEYIGVKAIKIGDFLYKNKYFMERKYEKFLSLKEETLFGTSIGKHE